MKRFFYLLAFATIIASCGGPEGEAVGSSEAVGEAAGAASELVAASQFTVDPSASVVNWVGAKLIGDSHTGTIPVSDGELRIAGGKLVGGKFTMDIRQLTNTDMPPADGGDKLVGHLKSADFFDVEKFPMASFVITKVQPVDGATDGTTHEISGDLTLKGETRNVTIPTTVSMDGDQFKASSPKFTIDRNDWGIVYGNSTIEGLAKDRVISDDVGLELMIVANK